MTSTHEKVSHLPASERHEHTPLSAAQSIEQALKFVEGRWKLIILFHLFGDKVLRFSHLERAIQMLAQQLRQLEADGVVRRIVHNQVPPKVEYCLTTWGQSLCPALDALLKWAEMRSPGAPDAGA
jgi:DNA-binding HxlR family transcriptional regulator